MRAMIGLIEPTYGEIEVDGRRRPRTSPRTSARSSASCPISRRFTTTCWSGNFSTCSPRVMACPRRTGPTRSTVISSMVGLTEKRDALIVELPRDAAAADARQDADPRPGVLLLDEPASGVDPQGRIDLKNILRGLADAGKTVLISSHILAEMNEFCTSVAIMERGRMVVSGQIDEVNAADHGGDPDRRWTCWVTIPRSSRSSPTTRAPGRSTARTGPGDTSSGSRATPARPASCWRRWCTAGCRVAVVRARRKDNLEELFLKVGSQGAVLNGSAVCEEWLDNPIFVKHLRSRLRDTPRSRRSWSCVVLCFCIAWGGIAANWFSNGYAFGALMGLLRRDPHSHRRGAGRRGDRRRHTSGILDFHRVSPLPPTALTLGFFFALQSANT